jgi:hypothetical protein
VKKENINAIYSCYFCLFLKRYFLLSRYRQCLKKEQNFIRKRIIRNSNLNREIMSSINVLNHPSAIFEIASTLNALIRIITDHCSDSERIVSEWSTTVNLWCSQSLIFILVLLVFLTNPQYILQDCRFEALYIFFSIFINFSYDRLTGLEV